jgi:hypothetical protein
MSRTKIDRLKALDAKTKALRNELGISAPGEVLFKADLSLADDDMLIVEADGLGGADLRVVEGNWPIDCQEKESTHYSTEQEACEEANKRTEE